MAWLYLFVAIILEVVGTTCMKLSEGFARIVPSVLVFVCYAASFAILIMVLKRINLSVAYAVWAGLGTALVAAIGIVWFKEPLGALKAVSLILIILGVVGLHLSEGAG